MSVEFNPASSFSVGDGPSSLLIEDIDKDGNLDLISTNFESNDVSVLLGEGDGNFGSAASFNVGNGPTSLLIEDIDKDGNLDLISTNFESGNVSVLLGEGDGNFGSAESFNVGDEPISLVAGDLNDDSLFDVVTANFESDNVSVLINTTPKDTIDEISKSSGSFTLPLSFKEVLQMLDNDDCSSIYKGLNSSYCEYIIHVPLEG